MIKQEKRKPNLDNRKCLEKRPQRSEGKVQNTFESPYKVFSHSDKREENDKLTLNLQEQRVIAK